MRPVNDIPAGLLKSERDRGVPPGGAMLIALGVSVAFWGTLVWLVL